MRFAYHLVAAVLLVAALGALSAARANHYILCEPEDQKCAESGWRVTGSLNSARSGHTATLIRDGKVLVAGGFDAGGNLLATAEIYDPATGTWAFTTPMVNARAGHSAFLLSTGEVLVIGGDPCCFSVSAEVYNPDNGVWTATPSLESPLGLASATMLPSGKIFLSGINNHESGSAATRTAAWLYDTQQMVWTRVRSDPIYRQEPSLSLLGDGTVLVTGGTHDIDEAYLSPGAEIYDPTTFTWNATSSPGEPRLGGATTVLADGSLLFAGGFRWTGFVRTAELYGTDGTWHSAGSLDQAREYHTATLLPDGRVLVTGGAVSDSRMEMSLASTEIYDPVAASWTYAESLNVARGGHTATLLDDGTVLVVGGFTGGTSFTVHGDVVADTTAVLGSAEIYHP